MAGLERLDDAGASPVELGVDPQRLAEMLECSLMVAAMEERPTLVGVRERVFGVVGQRRAERLLGLVLAAELDERHGTKVGAHGRARDRGPARDRRRRVPPPNGGGRVSMLASKPR